MKLIIAGGRTFHDYDTLHAQVNMLNVQITEVVSGAARGADQLGEQYARDHGIPIEARPADWSQGAQAGFERNEQMAHYADGAIVFWDGQSAGSRHMIDCMTQLGKPCRVISYASKPEPRIVLRHDGSDAVWLGTWDDVEQAADQIVDPVDPCHLPAGTIIENVGMYHSTVRPSMDFETYSEAGFVYRDGKVKGVSAQGKGGLPVVGTPAYAEHPSTEILCLYYDLKDGKGRRGWIPNLSALPHDLIEHVARGGVIEAWNATFEYWIWNLVCVPRYGFPPLPIESTVCLMARSRRHSLPGSLGNAAKVLGTDDKDKAGKALIQKLTRPHSPTKNRPEHRWTPQTAWQDFVDLWEYCDQDVKAEDDAAARIPDLTPYEHATWQVDQQVNARGVQVDVASLDAMLDILGQAEKHFNEELFKITGGAVARASEVAKILSWLSASAIHLPALAADDVKDALKRDDLPPPARRVLEIRKALASANIKKLPTLKLQVNSDGRLRDQYMYCGADRTGRWSAGGVQLQNITSKGPKSKQCDNCGRIVGIACDTCPECMDTNATECPEWTVEAVEFALADIARRDLKSIMDIWGDPITVLCGCLRGLFFAKEGHILTCCDFSAIEAVAAACLSRCQWRIDVFSTHGKIYEMGAAKITGTPFEEIVGHKERTGQNHPLRKTVGKVSELASGYGGWVGAWKAFGADEFMTDDEIKEAVLAWRAASPEIVEMWGGQHRQVGAKPWDSVPELYGLEGAAVAAILNPGQTFRYNDIVYGMKDGTLLCELPSGRFLHYHRAKVSKAPDRFKRDSYSITFEGWNSNAQKGKVGWITMETYGGRLFENVVQAVAYDIQAEALVRLEQRGYPLVMHTHDEGTAETPVGFGSVEEMEAIMSERPAWASWWPLRSAGWRHKRYQKD